MDRVAPVVWAGMLLPVALHRREPVIRGLVWSLVAVEISLARGVGEPRGGILLLTAGGILGIAVVESSFRSAYHDDLTGLSGRAFRYGGEELTRVYSGMPPGDVEPHLDAVRRSIQKARFVLRGPGRKGKGPESRRSGGKSRSGRRGERKTLSVTVSIGAASPGEKARTPRAVLEEADQALYRAKRRGRNRVVAG